MVTRVELLRGLERLDATTALLQRARLAHETAGVWEAADLQWWWRRPRASDALALPVWFDGRGPVAAAVLTDWGTNWQGDALHVPGAVLLEDVWSALLEAAETLALASLQVLAREDDHEQLVLLGESGFSPTVDRSGITWMDAAARPAIEAPPDGFRVVDRASRGDRPHPMRARNGDEVEARLRQCSLYQPELDLAIDDPDGDPAGYALFWFDPTTAVGLLEPMRVHERYQRRGLARVLLTEGLARLAAMGARRNKVGFVTDAARNLYVGAGFTVTAPVRAFERTPAAPPPSAAPIDEEVTGTRAGG